MPDYTVVETVPAAEDFCRLREISGLSPRPLEAAQRCPAAVMACIFCLRVNRWVWGES